MNEINGDRNGGGMNFQASQNRGWVIVQKWHCV